MPRLTLRGLSFPKQAWSQHLLMPGPRVSQATSSAEPARRCGVPQTSPVTLRPWGTCLSRLQDHKRQGTQEGLPWICLGN